MGRRLAGIVVGVVMASLAAAAAAKKSPVTAAARPAAKAVTHGARKPQANAARSAALPAAYAAMPEAQRRALQADLAWVAEGDERAALAGNFDARAIDAIKAFQARNALKETGVLDDAGRALLAGAAKRRQDVVGWQVIDDAATGARLGLPTKLAPVAGATLTGSRWTSGKDQIQIETFRLHEASLPALFEQEKRNPRQREVASSELAPDSFFIAGDQGLKNFLVRAQASGGEVRGITVLYDQATTGIMAPVASAIVDTFQGFPDPGAGPPGEPRSVEYGTAIAVDDRGDLVTLAHVTDACVAITVPGYGHADRIAADAAADLALIRLYGARDVTPAALGSGGETGAGDAFTLVGIADPLAQSSAGAVTRVAAQLTAPGFDPAPPPGFSGAAALDAQGRFAGLVDARGGASAAAPQSALVPADAVRAFLTAHGIAPAASHPAQDPPIDQSVLRVICVRK